MFLRLWLVTKTSGPHLLGPRHKSDKRQWLSGAGALYAMSEAMEHMAGGYGSSSTPGAVPGFQSSPEHMTCTIRLVEEQEVLLDDQAIFQTVGLFQHDHGWWVWIIICPRGCARFSEFA